VWWYRPIIPALKRLRQEDLEFQFSLHYLVGRCLKKKKKNPPENGGKATVGNQKPKDVFKETKFPDPGEKGFPDEGCRVEVAV
jgi:hypothetical protein